VKETITLDRERLNVANKMADKKKSTSQSIAAESSVRGSDKVQTKSTKRDGKQSSSFWTRFRNYRLVRFVREAYHELRYKVTWPTFQEARNMTFVVIALSAVIALLLGIADLALTKLFFLFTQLGH
jgi:preprotein translocase SecE subunit